MRAVNDSPLDRRRGRGRPRRGPGSGVPPRRGPAAPYDTIVERRRRRNRRRRVHAKRRIAIGLALVIILVVAAAAGGSLFVGNRYLAAGCTLKSLRPISLGQNSSLFASGRLAARRRAVEAEPTAAQARPSRLAREGNCLDRGPPLLPARRARLQGIARAAWSDLGQGASSRAGRRSRRSSSGTSTSGTSARSPASSRRRASRTSSRTVWTKNQILGGVPERGPSTASARTAPPRPRRLFFFAAREPGLTLPQAAPARRPATVADDL